MSFIGKLLMNNSSSASKLESDLQELKELWYSKTEYWFCEEDSDDGTEDETLNY